MDTFTSLPSAYFAIEEVREGETLTGYRLNGGGYGHGAGMSQNGANTMGNNGMTYQDILNFFPASAPFPDRKHKVMPPFHLLTV